MLAVQLPLNLEAPPVSFSEQALLVTCVVGGFCPCVCKLSPRIRWESVCTSMGRPPSLLPQAHLAEQGEISTLLLHLCQISGREGGLWASRHLDAARTALPADKPARQGKQRSDLLLALGCCCCGSGRGCCNPPQRIQPRLPSPGRKRLSPVPATT